MLRTEPPKAPQITPTGLGPTFSALSYTEPKVGLPLPPLTHIPLQGEVNITHPASPSGSPRSSPTCLLCQVTPGTGETCRVLAKA